MARRSLYLAILAFSLPYLYDRFLIGSEFVKNRPGALQPVYNTKSHEIKFQDRIRNCEDVVIDQDEGLAILSCDPGRDHWNTVMGTFQAEKITEKGGLWIYDYINPDIPDAQALRKLELKGFNSPDFHPLGIEWEADNSILYVVNHAASGSEIVVFHGSLRSGELDYFMTFKHELVHAPNSIHAIGNGRLFITNDHYMRAAVSPILSKVETWSGIPGGSVVYADLNSGVHNAAKLVARVPFANGITMLNKTMLAVASSSKPGVYFFDVDKQYNLTSKGYFRAPASVDNLSLDSNGKLLLAGHPFAPGLFQVSKRRPNCNPQSENEEERKACECDAPSWVAEWSPEGGLKTLYKGYEFCSSASMARDTKRGIGIVSGLYEKGIMIVKE